MAWTPSLQNIINSSTSGQSKVFVLVILTLSLPMMSNATIMKNHFVVSHGGRLYIGHVDHWHNISKIGLNPFMDKINIKFHVSLAKPSHVSSM
jgi:hypothetical protein